MGITAREKADPPKTRVQEVASAQTGLRIFVGRSDERESYERAQRLKAMERVKTQLEALQRRVEQGKLKPILDTFKSEVLRLQTLTAADFV